MSSEDSTVDDNESTVIEATLSDQFQQKMADAYAKNLEDNAPREKYIINVNGTDMVFKRRKILTKERKTLETLRAKLAVQARRNSPDSVETEDKLYKKCATFYLIDETTNKGMTEEQFEGIAFEDLKNILDACSYRTERPMPPLEEPTE